MDFDAEHKVEQIAAIPRVRDAAQTGEELTDLWPLTEAMHMDNDVHYAENLQVRLTRTAAQILTNGGDVTQADAEFVYEGADEIPGRPQSLVDALLRANDAYEDLEELDVQLDDPSAADAFTAAVTQAAQTMEVGWTAETREKVGEILHTGFSYIHEKTTEDTAHPDLAWRFAASVTVFDMLLRALREQVVAEDGQYAPSVGGAPESVVDSLKKLSIPALFLMNEVEEMLAVPRIYLSSEQLGGVLRSYATENGDDDSADQDTVLAESLAPLAAAEWKKHREDVLWDPAKAKEEAKKEDERKNKEALAAKFAHVKEDPTKPEVEL